MILHFPFCLLPILIWDTQRLGRESDTTLHQEAYREGACDLLESC